MASPTLTEAILSDLMTGNAAITLIPQISELTSSTSFADGNQLFTIKDTLNITQADPSKTEINIDQRSAAIDTAYEPGEYTITGQIPGLAQAIFDYFYNKEGVVVTGVTGSDGTATYAGQGYELDVKRTKATVLIESQSRKTAIAFMNVEFVVAMNASNLSTSTAGVNFTATVLNNPGAPEFYILKAIDKTPTV